MGKRIKIITVCTAGMGSCLMLKMTIDSVLKDTGIDAQVEACDITTARGREADILVSSGPHINAEVLQMKVKADTAIQNFVSVDEVEQKILPLIRNILST